MAEWRGRHARRQQSRPSGIAAAGPGQLSPWLPCPSSSGRHSGFCISGTNILRVGLIDPRIAGEGDIEGGPGHFDACVFLQILSARPWPSGGFTPELVGLADAKTEDEAASRWADYRFAYGSPLGMEWPDPMSPEPPRGGFGVTEAVISGDLAARRCASAGVAIQGVPVPPDAGGRSMAQAVTSREHGSWRYFLLHGHELLKVELGSGTARDPPGRGTSP